MISTTNRTEGVGIIIPPPEVRELLEKTASFIANAKKESLEARVIEKHRDDPRFTFLHESDPYHAYYRHRVAEIRAERNEGAAKQAAGPSIATGALHGAKHYTEDPRNYRNDAPTGDEDQGNATQLERSGADEPQKTVAAKPKNMALVAVAAGTTTTKAAEISFLKTERAKAEALRQEPREPPPEDVFSLPHVNPAPTALGLDVMKLTAQFAAQHGPDFVEGLARREGRNALFHFLKPIHPHFVAYQRLVDAYTLILDKGAAKQRLIKRLEALAHSRDTMLNEVWHIHDWECQKAEREHEAALDEREKTRRAQIDWHDFVVVATVDFDDSELDSDTALPAPVTDTRQLPRMLAAARKAQAELEKNRDDVDMDVDAQVATKSKPPRSDVERELGAQPKDARVELSNVDSDIPEDRIRRTINEPNGQTAANVTPQSAPMETTVVLPSGQRVPLSKMQQSVRAELLDPSYKVERARAAEKNRLQNLAGGDEVARNLARWEQAHKDGGVYNRGDLQEALLDKRKAPEINAATRVRKAPQSGPSLPDERANKSGPGESSDGRLSKRARVDKAVDALVKGKETDNAGGDEDDTTKDTEAETDKPEEKISGLLSGEEWIKKQGTKAKIRVMVTKHNNKDWKLQGQEINMSAPLKSTVAKLKSVMARHTKLPANRQKLQMDKVGFLKDKMTLAAYNLSDGAIITLEVKERGGRKKH